MDAQPQPISPAELKGRLDAGDALVLLDVRESEEVAICALPGVTHVPMGELSVRLPELDPDAETVCICHHGIRSAHVAAALAQMGFERLWNLSGGMDRWASAAYPARALY